MKERLKFHLDFAKGRDIVVWGTGRGSSEVIESLHRLGIEIKFFVSKEHDTLSMFHDKPVYSKHSLNKNEVYVIDATSHYKEIKLELEELGFKVKYDFYNWYDFIFSYDSLFNGIPVGKCTYFPESFSYVMNENSAHSIVSIGRFTSVNGSAQIRGDHPMKTISTGVFSPILGDDFHQNLNEKLHVLTRDDNYGKLEIGNDVWIGANAFINISKVKSIGDGAIIGAGAVVVEDVPPFAIVVGVPAKIKKYRYSPEQIKILNDVKWWNWSNSKIKENIELLVEPELFFKKFAKK